MVDSANVATADVRAVPSDARSSIMDRVRAEQVMALSRSGVVSVTGGIIGSCSLAAVLIFIEKAPLAVTLVWAASLVAVYIGQMALCVAHNRRPGADYRPWIRRFVAIAFLQGAVWGAGAVAIAVQGNVEHELIVLLIASAVGAGSAMTFGCVRATFNARFWSTNLPYVAWAGLQGDGLHVALALLTLVFTAVITQLVRQYNGTLVDMFRLRFENEALVGELRRQTDAANLANVTKSRFLAAASHDLRQPVHALSLFIGALQGRQMDDEARRLIELIDRSIEALDSLFVSLLDISRLDAGIVQPRLGSVAIQPLLDRVFREFEIEAGMKGLGFVAVPCGAVVSTDPILLERILRNLVSNAVRYTDRGRVLVGCRRRGGVLLLQVLDTGRGIAREERERVFQEFYQLDNPERDRSKGLGLGLAIVKRLSDLLRCDLVLSSEPGRGSVFTLAVPKVVAPPTTEVPAEMPPVASMESLRRRLERRSLILVVDDEIAIQEAMRSLLASWGHDAVIAGSTDDMLRATADEPRLPDLIICDYRLRGRENGIEAVRRLRLRYAGAVPALLITGDTAPDRLREAEASGLPLLHKPIHDDRLRTAINGLRGDGRPGRHPDDGVDEATVARCG